MQKTGSLTPKWQLHIPTAMRKFIGDEAPATIVFENVDGGILIKKADEEGAQFRELSGKYHHLLQNLPEIDLDNVRDNPSYDLF